MGRPVFLRPIEITDANKNFSVDIGAGAVDKVLTTGTYGNVLSLLDAFETLLDQVSNFFDVTIGYVDTAYTGTFQVSIATGATAWHIDWTDTDLQYLLGFIPDAGATVGAVTTGAANDSGEWEAVASLTPSHMWFPAYENTNQEFFALQQNRIFKGVNAASGQMAGLGNGVTRHDIMFDFEYEPASNIAEQFGTDSYVIARNFETFIYGARAEAMSSSTAESSRGFYFYADYTDAVPISALTALEGIQYGLTVSPDTHTFCHINANGSNAVPDASFPAGRERFNCSLRAITANVPNWDEP